VSSDASYRPVSFARWPTIFSPVLIAMSSPAMMRFASDDCIMSRVSSSSSISSFAGSRMMS